MTRSTHKRRFHQDLVYSSEEVMTQCGISANTLTNWKAQGLRAVENTRPNLFRGAELNRFFEVRAMRGKRRESLQWGEFPCLRCRTAVLPDRDKVWIGVMRNGKRMGEARCPECDMPVRKLLSETECDYLQNGPDHNSSLDSSDEEEGAVEAEIVISGVPVAWNPANERILHDWQIFAGKYNEKTVLAHAAAIREFERAIGLKPLTETTTDDAAAFRAELIAGRRAGREGPPLSASTLRHKASFLKMFFDWLAKFTQRTRLATVVSYFDLPKELHQSVPSRKDRDYISLEEAEGILGKFPTRSLLERRDRAIFATAYTAVLRKNALITLRHRHVDLEDRKILHHGRELRAKNGKTFVVDLFPGTDVFQAVLRKWVLEMQGLGAGPDDALFPDVQTLYRLESGRRCPPENPVWQPMKTAGSVDEVFEFASRHATRKITPHSARHTLVRLGYKLCLSPEQLKAWTMNMGHDDESTTIRNYGKMSEAEKSQVLRQLEEDRRRQRDKEDSTLSQKAIDLLKDFVKECNLRPEHLFSS